MDNKVARKVRVAKHRWRGKAIFKEFKGILFFRAPYPFNVFTLVIFRVVNIGSGFGTDSSAANDTQYRICSDGTLKKLVSAGYREVSIDTPIPLLRLWLV